MTEEKKGNYQVLLELCAAFNQHALDRIMAHFAEDSSLDMSRGNKPLTASVEVVDKRLVAVLANV